MDNFQLRVTDEQVAAAQLRAVLDEKLGRRTPELVRRIAVMTGGSERAEGEATSSHPVSSTPSVSAATEPTHQASRPYQGDCGEVLAEVWLFLDNEDDHEWSEVLKRHLDDGTCLEAFGLAEDVRALLASEDGGGQASDALRKRLRQSIKEIVTREAMTRAEVVVQQDDRGTFLDVRTSGVESRVGRVPPEASKDVWGQRLVPRARTGT
ncbi:MAG TPA: hypothetical protein VHH13_13170, partial [Arthrobacter sp.]|nr:hypothetical protein [Arthrobacter sp.]